MEWERTIPYPGRPCWRHWCQCQEGQQFLLFVRLFYGQPSRYLWEDEDGAIHHIHQGEGGGQGDPLMPLLFSLGQHAALEPVRRRLRVGERLFAFLDDIYVTTTPERVGIVHNILEQELYRHSRIHIHVGKTQVWNASGVRPPACDQLERLAQVSDPEARVWKGSDIPTVEQGVRILVPRWVIRITCTPSSRMFWMSMQCCFPGSLWLRTSSQHGHCSCTAPVDVLITC